MRPSSVQPWKATSQTSSGFTQVTGVVVFGSTLKGHFFLDQGIQFFADFLQSPCA